MFRMENRTFLVSLVKLKLQNLKLLPSHCCSTHSYLCVCNVPVTMNGVQCCAASKIFMKNIYKEMEIDFRRPPKSALFLDVTQRIVVIPYRCFGPT